MLLLRNDCSPGVKRRKNSDWPKQCSTVHVMKLCFMIFFLFPRQYCAQSIGQRFLLKSGRIQIRICYLCYKCAFCSCRLSWTPCWLTSSWPTVLSSSSATRLTGPAQPERTSSGRVIQYNVLILGNKIDRPGRSRRGRAEVGLFPIEIESLCYLLCKTAAIKFVRDRYRYISKWEVTVGGHRYLQEYRYRII